MLHRVAQSVVTDAGSGQSAGYALVAWSPSLAPEDANALQSRPEVTDYLHQSANTTQYRSFFPLPSGAWALSFRFVHGTRRGTYNRVVVYTLVLGPEILEACDHNAFAISACRFTPLPGGDECPLEALLAHSATADGSLPDLAVRPPPASGENWTPPLEPASVEVLKTLPAARLEADLAWIYAACRYGRRVLLDDDARGHLLLTLACTALPRHDRMRTPWTEHLAGGAAFPYFLACAPNPAELASSGQLADRWDVFPAGGAPQVRDEGARAFAAGLLGPGGAGRRAELESNEISVLEGEELTQWARHRRTEAADPATTPVGEYLDGILTGGGVPRWGSLGEVIHWLARNLRARLDDGGAAETARESVAELQQRRQLGLVSPGNVAAAELPRDVAGYGALLSLASLGTAPRGHQLQPLVEVLAPALRDQAWSAAAVQLIVFLLDQAPPSIAAIRRLDPTATDLIQVADAVAGRAPGDEAAHLRVFHLATGFKADEAVLHVVRQYLLPIWEATSSHDTLARDEEVQQALQVLLRDPVRFAAALTRLRGRHFAAAASLLRSAAGDARESVCELAAALARSGLPCLPADPAVRGVAAALESAGADVAGWMPFLLAEAAVVDAAGKGDDALIRWIERLELPPATADRVLEGFAQNGTRVWAPVQHALFMAAFRFSRSPAHVTRILARVGREGGTERRAWDETVAGVAEALGSAPEAVSIRLHWLQELARNGPLPLSPASRGMIDALSEADKLVMVRAWSERDQELARDDPESWQRMKQAAQNDPHLGFPYLLADLQKELGTGAGTDKVLQLLFRANAAAARTDEPVEAFALACRKLLPSGAADAAVVVLEAAQSNQLWPTSIQALRTPFLANAFGQVNAGYLADVAQREPRWLALAAARELGCNWSSDVPASLTFVAGAWDDAELLGLFQAASEEGTGPAFPPGLAGLMEKQLAARRRADRREAPFVWPAADSYTGRRE